MEKAVQSKVLFVDSVIPIIVSLAYLLLACAFKK